MVAALELTMLSRRARRRRAASKAARMELVRSTSLRPQRRELAAAIALSTLSGCLWFLSCTPFDLSALSWIAMVPALFVLDHAPNRRSASLLCWLAGTVMVAGGFYWMIQLLRRFAGLPLPAAFGVYLIFSAYQGSVFLIFGWMAKTIRRSTRLPMVVIAPLAMVTAELAIPLLFPSHLAIMQAWHPLVIQIADLAGPLGVTALLLVVNGAIYDVLAQREKILTRHLLEGSKGSNEPRWRALAPAVAAILLVTASLIYGHFRIRQFDELSSASPKLTVGIVQPNVAYNEKGLDHPERAASELVDLQQQSRDLENSGAQLIVWTETAYPYSLPRDFHADFTDSRQIRRGFTTPTVVGALTTSAADHTLYNSAILIDRAGNVTGRYDKMRLLAFGETIPGIEYFPWLRNVIPQGFGDFTPGAEVSVLPLAADNGNDARLGAVICYEDILPGLLRRMGRLHPHMLLNLTNDTWFGAHAEPWQHLALAVFASIEQRTFMVRAVNSGVSAFVDANGRVVQKIDPVDPYYDPQPAQSTVSVVPLLEGGHTVYARVGDLFAYLCALAALILVLRAEVRGDHEGRRSASDRVAP